MVCSTLKEQMQAVVLLCVLGLVSFYATLTTPMLYDDLHAVVDKWLTRSLEPYPEAFDPDGLFNRPVLMFTFALNRALGGEDVFGYHLVNVALHIAVGLTFYSLLWRLLCLVEAPKRAALGRAPFWAAALHLVHPLAVQPVAYLSGRSSLLATWLFLLGLLNLVRFYQKDRSAGLGGLEHLVLFGVFFYLGCGAKAIVITLPVMAVLFVWLRWPEDFLSRRGLECGLILAPLLAYLLWRAHVLGDLLSLPNDPTSGTISRKLYFLTEIKSFVFYYLLKYLLPVNQNFEPDVRLVSGWGDGGVWTALMLVLAAGIWLWRCTPRLFWFWGAWVLITLAPTSSFVPLKQIVTEHRFYLPGLGLSLIVAGLWARAAAARPRLRWGFAAVLLLCFLLTQNRARDFQSAVALWEDTARKSPNKALVHNNLAVEYLALKRFADAERELQTTLTLQPRHAQARINLGVLFTQTGRLERAAEEFLTLIRQGSRDPVVFYNAGLALKDLKRPQEALPYLQKAVELKPENADYQFALGQAYQLLKRHDEALLAYRHSLKVKPGNAMAHLNMGTIFWEQGHFYFADIAFHQAYELAPESTIVLSNLTSSNMVFHNYDQAVHILEEWLKLEPGNTTAQELLTAARRLQKAPKP